MIFKSLFQTPIQISEAKIGLLNVELNKLIYRLKEKNNSNEMTKHNGFQSIIYNHKDFLITNQFINVQINFINNYISQFQLKQNHEWNIKGLWFNVNPKYSLNNLHTHCDCDFSAVYYIQVPKNSGNIIFENPNPVMLHQGFYQNQFYYNEFNSNSFEIEPKDNMLILFPSYLPHRVGQNLSDQDRISLSFNIKVDIK